MTSRLGQNSIETALRDMAWVAEYLDVSKSWVYQAVESGVLPCIKLGALLRFDAEVIKAWSRGQATSARAVRLPSCR
ncbi:MAG: helix-turn-helix domain-containing protein [Myxococcota bacterium]